MPPPSKASARPCAVYRLWAYTGQLAYVGVSVNPDDRWKQIQNEPHRHWIQSVVTDRTVEWHPNVAVGRDHETAAIRTEAPLFNVHVARRGWVAPILRWLTPADAAPVPCMYWGWWILGHDRLRAAFADPPRRTSAPCCADDAGMTPFKAAKLLYEGSIDEAGAARLSRPALLHSYGRCPNQAL